MGGFIRGEGERDLRELFFGDRAFVVRRPRRQALAPFGLLIFFFFFVGNKSAMMDFRSFVIGMALRVERGALVCNQRPTHNRPSSDWEAWASESRRRGVSLSQRTPTTPIHSFPKPRLVTLVDGQVLRLEYKL